MLLLSSCGIQKSVKDRPDVSGFKESIPERKELAKDVFVQGNDHLLKNESGQWEMRVDGDPLELGLTVGSLTQELFHKQEQYIFAKVEDLVPSKFKQKLVRRFLAYFNRKMYTHIDNEFKAEIFGISQYAAHTYDYVADPYMRILYLHGAHDIGHAVQDLALVGCTSFAVWNEHSMDSTLVIGRNFDFYAGDDFAKEKIIAFIDPDQGHSFMSVTWGGMMGVVSGMNEKGLTVTINAGHSKIPTSAKTPISILTREILQYAENIEQAIAIAKTREVFVSESIMVGSAADRKAVIIEVSPKDIGVYEVQNTGELICSNHFQSAVYASDKENIEHMKESHSLYRYERMAELLDEHEKVDEFVAASILRNRMGLKDQAIGNGNEKALNQLLAHHAIIFKPEERMVWVSSNPYQLGEFMAYDLKEIFGSKPETEQVKSMAKASRTIPEDPFLRSDEYRNYEFYRVMENELEETIKDEVFLGDESFIDEMGALNPAYYKGYYLAGQYYQGRKNYEKAIQAYEMALSKEITTLPEREDIQARLKKAKRKAK
jgi:predicted choloylglycine hydrolase